MQRRKFIASIGSVAAGAAAVTGTGAFTSTTAERSVEVSVAADSDSFLALNPAGGANGAYAEQTGDESTLEFNFDEQASNEGGQGLNPDATTVIAKIFTIANQGTQPVGINVSAAFDSSLGDGSFTIFDDEDPDGNDLSSGYTDLETGSSLSVGVEITSGQPADLTGTVTIEGDADEYSG
jgi:hypothetical protein